MDVVAMFLGGAALLVAAIALVLALGVAVRLKGLEDATLPPRMGLPVGTLAPREPLTSLLDGDSTWLHDALVLFVSPDCGPCRELLTALHGRLTRTARQVILVEPPPEGGETLANVLDVPAIRVVDEGGAVRGAFQAHATPHTFLVRDGRIADQLLGANVERVLAMVAPDASRALSGVGAA
ncbi:MAG: hypothetical protein C4343_04545 [Chloroflexota bacterium]